MVASYVIIMYSRPSWEMKSICEDLLRIISFVHKPSIVAYLKASMICLQAANFMNL